MPDTHVPLDEEVKKRTDELLDALQIKLLAGDKAMFYIKQFIGDELAHLKHTIRVEIGGLKQKKYKTDPSDTSGKDYSFELKANEFISSRNRTIDDALSVKSLKESDQTITATFYEDELDLPPLSDDLVEVD